MEIFLFCLVYTFFLVFMPSPSQGTMYSVFLVRLHCVYFYRSLSACMFVVAIFLQYSSKHVTVFVSVFLCGCVPPPLTLSLCRTVCVFGFEHPWGNSFPRFIIPRFSLLLLQLLFYYCYFCCCREIYYLQEFFLACFFSWLCCVLCVLLRCRRLLMICVQVWLPYKY